MTQGTPDSDGQRGVIINTASVAAYEGQVILRSVSNTSKVLTITAHEQRKAWSRIEAFMNINRYVCHDMNIMLEDITGLLRIVFVEVPHGVGSPHLERSSLSAPSCCLAGETVGF